MGSIIVNKFKDKPESFFEYQFHYAKEYRKEHNKDLPHNQFWDYLKIKHDLHPHRFDHYHPIIGRWIEQVPKSFVPLNPIIPIEPIIPEIPVKPIPEPTSLILISTGLVGIFILRKIFR